MSTQADEPVRHAADPEFISHLASTRAFGQKLVMNVHRGLLIEAIVSTVLCPEWRWCSEDYWRCDFEDPDGISLEVKQSAACQSWPSSEPSVARWDIAERKGYYEGARYIAIPGRKADLYVLAWHPIKDRADAYHRDPSRWQFYVVRSSDLPPTKTMGIRMAEKKTQPVSIDQLKQRVADTVMLIA